MRGGRIVGCGRRLSKDCGVFIEWSCLQSIAREWIFLRNRCLLNGSIPPAYTKPQVFQGEQFDLERMSFDISKVFDTDGRALTWARISGDSLHWE